MIVLEQYLVWKQIAYLIRLGLSSSLYCCLYIYIYIYIERGLSGIELVGTNISQLVSAVTFFQGNFWNYEFSKNSMPSIIFYSILTSVVISRLSYLRLAEIRRRREQRESPFYLQHSWLSPNGTSNFILKTQRLSLPLPVLLWSCVNIAVRLSW